MCCVQNLYSSQKILVDGVFEINFECNGFNTSMAIDAYWHHKKQFHLLEKWQLSRGPLWKYENWQMSRTDFEWKIYGFLEPPRSKRTHGGAWGAFPLLTGFEEAQLFAFIVACMASAWVHITNLRVLIQANTHAQLSLHCVLCLSMQFWQTWFDPIKLSDSARLRGVVWQTKVVSSGELTLIYSWCRFGVSR